MSRNLDTSMAAALPNGLIYPAVLVELTFKSGTVYAWSGVGDLIFDGNTFKGVGEFGKMGSIQEGDTVHADGTTVTLSGIALTTIAQPDPGAGITPPDPPVTVPAGQSVAWAYAGTSGGTSSGTGSASGTFHTGLISVVGLDPPPTLADRGTGEMVWENFSLPPLPSDAVIHALYPTIVISAYDVSESDFIPNNPYIVTGTGMFFRGPDPGSLLPDEVISIELDYSVDGAIFNDSVTASFVGIAVYYSSVSGVVPPESVLQEVLNDIQTGAPAKIWFGLMASGAFIGAPYLIFSGNVDKPLIEISAETMSVTLALENKLVNLQRPTQRRYTAADQHLTYPDDLGFNWVEMLNDIALRWG